MKVLRGLFHLWFSGFPRGYIFVSVFFVAFSFLGVSSVWAATLTDSLQLVYYRQMFIGKVYPQERVYLHLDKPYYQVGDELYYKIYATIGQGLFPDTLSKTLYVELLDASGTVLVSQKKFLSFGLGYGSMTLNSGYAPGVYRLRAFTSWMRNFRSDPLFEKVITIYGSLRKDYNWHLSSSVSEGPELDTLHLTLHLTDSLYRGVASPYEFSFNAKGVDRSKGTYSTGADGSNRMILLLPKDRTDGLGRLTLTVGDNTQQQEVVLATANLRVEFFPEGGQWVAGVPSRVAFKIRNEKGTGLSGRGVIKDAQGVVVARFESQHRGMGTLRMTPESGAVYTAEVTVDAGAEASSSSSKILKVPLPEVLPFGYVMEADGAHPDSIRVSVRRGGIHREEILGVMIQNGGQVLWRGFLRMRSDSSTLRLSKATLPTGVSQITLYRSDGTPLSERLVFVNNHDALNIQITAPKQNYQPREKVSLNLRVTDAQGNPVQGSFSFSVTDRSQVKDTAQYGDNLLTHLLLASEIRGHIEDPGYYFASETPAQRQALEYLLMTQGWRRYRWDMALADTLPKLEYAVERGIPISGTIRNITTEKAVGGHEVTLMLQNSQGMQAGTYTTNETGHFKFMTDFFGEARVNIQTKKKGNAIERAIDFDQNELTFDEVAEGTSGSQGETTNGQALTQTLSRTQAAVEEYQKTQETVRAYLALTDSLMKTYELKEIEVTARWNPMIEITKQADTTLMVREVLESVRDYTNYGITSVEDFLANTYRDHFQVINDMPRYLGSGSDGTGIGGRAVLYLVNGRTVGTLNTTDDVMASYTRMREESINCYSKVEIIDNVGAASQFTGPIMTSTSRTWEAIQFTGLKMGPSNPNDFPDIIDFVVVALTTNPNAVCYEQQLGVRSYKMQGYATSKEFYSPDYDQDNSSLIPDVRSTLFWEPHVQTDSSGKATVTFFNSDLASKMGVHVEGVANMGTTGAGAATLDLGM